MEQKINEIELNGITYVPKNAVPSGNRAVVVIDRGWVYAGDVEDRDGRIYLTRVVHVESWEAIGFEGVLADPMSSKVRLTAASDKSIPAAAEIFRAPVPEDWGL